MDLIVYPSALSGTVTAIPSKSQAHRLLICAAFADKQTHLICPQTNRDIEATVCCLNALGANIIRTDDGYTVTPISSTVKEAQLHCAESGSTLRFLLPIVGAIGVNATFHLEGRLSQRPLSPLWEEMERMGCVLSRPTENTIKCQGKLRSGNYTIAGNVSSQYVTGLLFAAVLIHGETKITVTGILESAPYVELTKDALAVFGVNTYNNTINSIPPLHSPKLVSVEGDWSNAAFFIAASKLGHSIEINGLNDTSSQGDRAIVNLLNDLTEHSTIDVSNIPDLVPILAVYAACHKGATFQNIGRLRLKESDRIATVASMLENLGANTHITENSLSVFPANFHGCTIDAANDHRIAMAAAIAALRSSDPIIIRGAQCVEKSYPSFWNEYKRLGGNYEQYIR